MFFFRNFLVYQKDLSLSFLVIKQIFDSYSVGLACALYLGVGLNGLNKLYPFFIMLNCTNQMYCGFLG